jgi:hypothetical protein
MRQAALVSPVALPVVLRNLFFQDHSTPPCPLSAAQTRTPLEVNKGCSYNNEEVLTPERKHEGTDVLVSGKAQPHAPL